MTTTPTQQRNQAHSEANRSASRNPHLVERLRQCEVAARKALHSTLSSRDQVLSHLERFARATKPITVAGSHSAESEQIRQAQAQFSERLGSLASSLDLLSQRARSDLAGSYAHLEANASVVTIMLFGRTRAGKSTLMEALTHGDGKSIGKGKQHATREVAEYFWPSRQDRALPNAPSLRIVDTPGIEGFKGNELAVVADRFVERSDHIFFLLSDDKAGTEELERFGLIRTHGKSVTVLLNVKSRDQDMDVLVNHPDLIFRRQELDGHEQRIRNYLRDRFDLPVPSVIPVHARAGWLSTQSQAQRDGQFSSDLLRERSQLSSVEGRIVSFIEAEALPARIRAPRDLIRGYIITVKSELRPFAGQFRKLGTDMASLRAHLEKGISKTRSRATQRMEAMRATLEAAREQIPLMVDELAAKRSRGSSMRAGWEKLLQDAGVKDGLNAFVAETTVDFQNEVKEQVRVASFDVKLNIEDRAEDLLDEYVSADESAHSHKYARAAIRTGAGATASGLAWWAVTNFWNPTGWAAAVAAVGAAVVGIAADRIAKAGTDSWKESTETDLRTKRDAVVGELRNRLKRIGEDMEKNATAWLDEVCIQYTGMVTGTLGVVERGSDQMRATTIGLLRTLDEIASDLDKGLITDLLATVVPEIADGTVEITRVARDPGVITKIRVRSRRPANGSPVGFCIGRGGCRVRRLRDLLGGEVVVFVDGGATIEEQVSQALRPATVCVKDIVPAEHGGYAIHAPAGTAGWVIGHRGTNIRLASWLVGHTLAVVD